MNNRSTKIVIVLAIIILPVIFYLLFWNKEEPVIIQNLPPAFVNIPDQVINEGEYFQAIDLYNFLTDPDNKNTEINISISKSFRLSNDLTKEGLLSVIQPGKDWFGSDTMIVTATDPDGLSANTKIVFIVNPVNDPPQISEIPGQTIKEGGTFASIHLNNFVSDIDNTPDEISWGVLGQTLVDVKIDNNNVAHIKTKDENIYGSDTLLFIASDPEHRAATKRVVLNITPVNDPPEVRQIELPVIKEGESFPVVNLDDYVDDIDTPIDKLKFNVASGKYLSSLIDKDNRLTLTPPSPDWFGNDTLIFSVSDSTSISETVVIATVLPVNDAPQIAQIPSQVIKENAGFQPIPLNNFVNDIDNSNEELHWSFSGNCIIDIAIDKDNILQAYVQPDKFGVDTVTIAVTDAGGLQAKTNVIFSVIENTLWERAPFKEIKFAAYTAVDDFLALAVSPYYWNGYDYLKFGLLTSSTTALTSVDKDIQTEVMNDRKYSNSDLLRLGEYYGRNTTSIGASIGFFGAGLISGETELIQIGLEVFESFLIVNEFTTFLKNAFGRERPYNGTVATNFYIFENKGQAFHSLPSGHTALAFSLSSVLAAHTDNIILKSIIFTPAIATAVERVYNNNHWVSDVVLGGAIGYFVGSYLSGRHKQRDSSNLIIGITPQGEIGFIYNLQ